MPILPAAAFNARPKLRRRRHEPAPTYVSLLQQTDEALARARMHISAHRFAAALIALQPFAASVPEPLAGPYSLLLGRCAMHGCGGDAFGHLQRALRAYAAAEDNVGLALVRRCLATACAARGDLAAALEHLRVAVLASAATPQGGREAAEALRLQAEIHLWQRALPAAQGAIEAALQACMRADTTDTLEARTRLTRAHVAAACGHMQHAARDMLWAERLVGPETDTLARWQVALARAESLLGMDYPRRAAAGLEAHRGGLEALEDAAMRAHYNRLMGCAYVVDAPAVAHEHLAAANAFFAGLGQHYYWTQCALAQVRCAHRLGLPTQSLLAQLSDMASGQWPVLQDELGAVRQRVGCAPGRLTGPATPRSAAGRTADIVAHRRRLAEAEAEAEHVTGRVAASEVNSADDTPAAGGSLWQRWARAISAVRP
jgi:tetratricopeptide (TPR) repeat protein